MSGAGRPDDQVSRDSPAQVPRWPVRQQVTDDEAREVILTPIHTAGSGLIETSPELIEMHNKAKRKITEVLGRIVDDHDLGEAYADGVLLTNEEARLSTEPDFAFVSWASFESGRVRLVEKTNRDDDFIEIHGTPDLVVEIVSDSSVRKDTRLLHDAYLRAGVPEYWLIDARVGVSFQILALRDGAYQPTAADGEPQPSRVLSRTFAFTRERNRAGRWRYALHVGD